MVGAARSALRRHEERSRSRTHGREAAAGLAASSVSSRSRTAHLAKAQAQPDSTVRLSAARNTECYRLQPRCDSRSVSGPLPELLLEHGNAPGKNSHDSVTLVSSPTAVNVYSHRTYDPDDESELSSSHGNNDLGAGLPGPFGRRVPSGKQSMTTYMLPTRGRLRPLVEIRASASPVGAGAKPRIWSVGRSRRVV